MIFDKKINGIILINKPEKLTSYDIVYRIKKIINLNDNKIKVGHTGTLDPFATGLLVITFSDATKLTLDFQLLNKEYIAKFKFGIKTDSDDCTGKVLTIIEKKIKFENIKQIIKNYIGKIYQRVPIFSAKSINEKRLYKYARQNILIDIPVKRIFIYNIDLIDFDYKEQILTLKINCSSGTYIRSLARDIGEALGSFCIAIELFRTKIGEFYVMDALNINNIKYEDILDNYKSIEEIFNKYFINKNVFNFEIEDRFIKDMINGNYRFIFDNLNLSNISNLAEIRLFFKEKLIFVLNKIDNCIKLKYFFKNNIIGVNRDGL